MGAEMGGESTGWGVVSSSVSSPVVSDSLRPHRNGHGFGMALGSLSINVQSYIPILLKMWCGASGTEVYWPWP